MLKLQTFPEHGLRLPLAMKKKPPISEEDLALFRQEMKSVRPLNFDTTDVHRPLPPKPALLPKQRAGDESRFPVDGLSDHTCDSVVEAGDLLFFSRPGLQHRQLLKLRKGRLNVGAELDLHGLNSSMARQQLLYFIAECQNKNIRCARIIHGKGLSSRHSIPILKNRINTWLKQLDAVLAFCSTPLHDGGTGAVYVLLKK